uniref:Uncharacterized protein n=1 Tax=Arundo donax TaxID=35708 RepID=A0A0A9E0T7_ARUDO
MTSCSPSSSIYYVFIWYPAYVLFHHYF